jgi:hypothetical protein
MMSKEPRALHVNPSGENWDVESVVGTIAQAETKEEAIEAAREAAAEHRAESIIVHTSDGMVEKEIPVK